MDLTSLIDDLLKQGDGGVAAIKKNKPDILLAMVVPKKIFTDQSYKREDGTVNDDHGHYFDSCASDLGKAIDDSYGNLFENHRIQTEETTDYVFNRGNTIITYSLSCGERYESAEGSWSTEIRGFLLIREPDIDVPKTGVFLRKALDTHLLDYCNGSVGIFYVRTYPSKSQKQGIALLKEMSMELTEAAVLISDNGFETYAYKEFAEGELLF